MTELSTEDIKKIYDLSGSGIDYIDNCQSKMTLIQSMLEIYENEEPKTDICTWMGLKGMISDWSNEIQKVRDLLDNIEGKTINVVCEMHQPT